MDLQKTENDLIAHILTGNTEDFKILINHYQKLVAHIVYRFISNAADREELGQEIFIRVYQNLSSFQGKSKLSTWIGRIAHNACLNYLKKKKIPLYDDQAGSETSCAITNEPSVSDSITATDNAPDQQLINEQIAAFLQQEIDHLPQHYRQIILLYHIDEMSYHDIGEILNLPEGTVKSYLFRARKQLKERLLSKYQIEELYQ